ncbi:hypothetical protein CDD82_6045 [Ophiocordyceps australis]|uniref:CAP-Gly domain-containing protein n=1 Tax=Ophiocordyceps australis TaxID=1399860 RepID=A0A2C5YRZ9_9HYPO|nr:hypothetical protein CDD82_6045 [Ophiocordyceps australis]
MTASPYVGQRISYGGALCTVRYVGPVAGTSGSWLGVEWDDGSRGRHKGSHKGVSYFTCLSSSPTAASFVRPSRPADTPRSFVAALKQRYAPDDDEQRDKTHGGPIVISGKVAEEMGFDKLRRRLARLRDLRIALLDGWCVASPPDDTQASVADTCPAIEHLDLSRNLLERLGSVLDICGQLPALRRLSLNGNRFHAVLDDPCLEDAPAAMSRVEELGLGETLLGWEELGRIATACPSLTSLAVGTNQLCLLPTLDYGTLVSTLSTVNLEYNSFKALSDIASLASLGSLRNLDLKGNSISAIAAPGAESPIFPPSLHYLDMSYNEIGDWAFVDGLGLHFPGLTGLRIAHNPVYGRSDTESGTPSLEESHMMTVARLGRLKSVNFTQVRQGDRANAEMFYLSRIARQLAAVPEAAEHTVLARHPRYAELCEIYGAPDILRRDQVNPSFLEARLVTVAFYCGAKGPKTVRIPRSFDIYAVRGIAGKLFRLSPLKIRLVWETGEWDPVAGYDEAECGSDADDADDGHTGHVGSRSPPCRLGESRHEGGIEEARDKSGRWVKREAELTDGPKQLGYCVDGHDVKIRLEVS